MLHPSDITPKGVIYDPKSGRSTPDIFTTECVDFNSNGSMILRFHGIKNDTQRSGLEVVDSSTVSRILEIAIELAGLSGKGFNSNSCVDPDIIMKTGLRKTVHNKTSKDMTTNIIFKS